MEGLFLDAEDDPSGSGALWQDNDTSPICAAESLEALNKTVLPSSVIISSRVLQSIYVSIVVIFGLFLNCLVVHLVFKYKRLQTPAFIVAVQIAVADIIISLALGVPTILSNFAGRWVLGINMCILSGFLGFFVLNIRTILVFAFSLDRFASVCFPFVYPRYSRKIVIVVCILAWTISSILSLVMIPQLLDCYIYSQAASSCVFSSRCGITCRYMSWAYSATIVLPTTFLPIGFFTALYIKGRKIRRNEARLRALSESEVSDWRAIKTFSLIFVATFLVIIPPVIIAQISALFGSVVRTLFLILSSTISYILVVTDPIMILKNEDVREILSKIKKYWLDRFRSITIRLRRESAA